MKILNSLKSILWFALLAGVAAAQTLNPADSQFIQNFGTDSINLQNLSIGISAPVIGKSGAFPFGYSLAGTSGCSMYAGSVVCSPNTFFHSWQFNGSSTGTGWASGYLDTGAGNFCTADNKPTTYYTRLYVVSPDHTVYYLPSTDIVTYENGGSSCAQSVTDYTVLGGVKATLSGYLAGLVSVTLPNGTVAGRGVDGGVTDTFGNRIIFSYATHQWTDTLNTTALTVTGGVGLSADGEIDTYTDTTGASQQVKQLATFKTFKTLFGCGNEENATGYATTEIDYPDGNNIYLAYEPISGGVTGRISQITLRTGGNINYLYGALNSCGNFIPSSVTRTTVDGSTSYTFATFTGASSKFGTKTTVLDPGKNKTVYQFMGTDSFGLPQFGIPLTLTQVQVYQNTGTVAAPTYTLLSTTIYCYNGNATACPTTQAAYPILTKDTYVAPGTKTTYARTKQTFDTKGNVLTSARYDFTTIGGGTPNNTTTITYGSWNGSACVAVGSNIINLPCDVKTTDGASHVLSESRHTYSTKGFETQTQNWTGSLWISATAVPNAKGATASSTSPLGLTTTYTYAPTGSGGCNGLLLTGTSATVNGVILSTGKTWDCNGGKLLSVTDTNGGVSHFTYDNLLRPFSQSDPTTYEIDERYPTATTSTVFDQYATTTTAVDGLGRAIRTQTTDGASYATVSANRSFNGPNFQTNTSQPCFAGVNADCTAVHYTQTDPLGRTTYSSTANNEIVTTAYSQNDVSTTLSPAATGEHTKTVQAEADGLGRPKSTCALQTTGGTACGQIAGGAGILTTFGYSYAAGSSTMTATRGVQVHTIIKDALGRMKSVQTPEAGTTTATYDTIITADACHGAGFNAYGTVLRTTNPDGSYACFSYDLLGRTTDVGNSNNVTTPCKRFRYDSTSNGYTTAPTGYSGQNLKGRLMEAETDNCSGTLLTDEWFSYDDDDRVTDVWEKTPHSGGYYHTTATYYPNGQFHALSGVPGKSTYTVALDANGRPYSSTYGTATIGSNATYNAAGQPTLINYGTTGQNATYGFDEAYTGRMSNYAFNSGGYFATGALTWNPNGTLQTFVQTDQNGILNQTCTFGYDDVSRLLTDNCGALWNQSFSYDQYDNLKKSGSSSFNPNYSATNNHITDSGFTYDGNGNVAHDSGNAYQWDAYGKPWYVSNSNLANITYDAFGQRAEKVYNGVYTEFLYSPVGLVATMNGQSTTLLRLPVPGGALFENNGINNSVYFKDWLGSIRYGTNVDSFQNIFDTAYAPYGEQYNVGAGSATAINFTGDFQDVGWQFGLYDTPNREFDSGSGGRWLSPDPAHASWNAYAYPTNPNSNIDPTGLEGECDGGDGCTQPNDGPGQTAVDMTIRACDISNSDGTCYASQATTVSLEDISVSAADATEPTFSGGFLGGGSDAAAGMIGNLALGMLGRTSLSKWWQETGCQNGQVCLGAISPADGEMLGKVANFADRASGLPSTHFMQTKEIGLLDIAYNNNHLLQSDAISVLREFHNNKLDIVDAISRNDAMMAHFNGLNPSGSFLKHNFNIGEAEITGARWRTRNPHMGYVYNPGDLVKTSLAEDYREWLRSKNPFGYEPPE